MFEMSEATIEAAMPRISSGLEKYFSLQTAFPKTDVTKDREFKRNFNGFYRVRRGADWQRSFYDLLEQQKKCPQSFVDVLTALHSRTGRVEASFVSKLIATANPDQSVIDNFLLMQL